MRLRISMLIQIKILRFPVPNHDSVWLNTTITFSYNTYLYNYRARSIKVWTHLFPFCNHFDYFLSRQRWESGPMTWFRSRSGTGTVMWIRLDPQHYSMWNAENTVLWNRNDLLLLRVRLLKNWVSGSGSRKYLAKIFKYIKICTQSCHFNDRSSVVSQKVGLSFNFLTFIFHFILNPDPIRFRFR